MPRKLVPTLVIAGLIAMNWLPANAFADAPLLLEKGARVRVTVVVSADGNFHPEPIIGTLVEQDTTAITLETKESDSFFIIPRKNLWLLEKSTEPCHRTRNTFVGLGIGLASGAIIGYAAGDDPAGMMSFTAEGKAAASAVILGLLGALVGNLNSTEEQWEAVSGWGVQPGIKLDSKKEGVIFISCRF